MSNTPSPSPQAETYITIAKLGAPHGIEGYIRLHSFTSPIDNVLHYSTLQIKQGNSHRSIEITDAHVRAKDIIVKITGYDDRNKASELTHSEIVIPKTELPVLSDGEYYWHQLIGLTVLNRDNQTIGIVEDLLETGSNDVLIVLKPNGKKTLIPYLMNHFIDSIHLEDKKILVDWDSED